jgi:putative ABC transport system ATP-binding protein
MAEERVRALLKVIDKIPMFAGLGADPIKRLLSVCEFRSVTGGQVLFRAGDPSSDMLVLLSGRLRVSSADGVELAIVTPAAPVGEMGLITGQPRSATVEATDPSRVLALHKTAFDRLMRSHPAVSRHVYRNVVRTLAARQRDSELQQRTAAAEYLQREAVLDELELAGSATAFED